jgi:hypothetical protein
MAIKYEYSSECCNHFYVETRNNDDAQVVSKCNSCGTGEYQETNRTEIESIVETIYVASDEQVVSVRDRLILAGFTEEEINALINEQTI